MKVLALAALSLALMLPPPVSGQPPTPAAVLDQQAGPTPFISVLHVATGNVSALRSIRFEVAPKPGSVTRPVSAVYFADYLASRGYLDPAVDRVTVPVFGLYPGYANTVRLTYRYADGSSTQDSVAITTAAFDDPQGFNSPTVLQPRTATTALSYDYFSAKTEFEPSSPVLIDTDGAVRWVGTTGLGYSASVFTGNSFIVPAAPPGGDALTGVGRQELDGTFTFLQDYSADGVTIVGHHNYDPGREGVLLEVTTADQVESRVYEVDLAGNLLHVWDLAAILRATMTAGGDDPSGFVYDSPTDWFHNNSAAYRAFDNTLIVSSRESFVIALDYDSGAVKWILGDPTKHWYQYPSLRRYALALTPGSLPPIGQHAVSITHDDSLLLFDDGANSMFQTPQGDSRTYSSPRKYRIDTQARLADEIWNYPDGESILSKYTSSVYEDNPLNYLIDYANITINNAPTYAEFVGLTPAGDRVFDYRYPAPAIGFFAWNAIPIHLENLIFTGPQTALATGHPGFFTGEQALTNGVYYLSFPANGNVFGYYAYLTDPHYFYHFGLGYEYWFDAADSGRGVYLYDFASRSFFYTSPQFPFPYLYDFSLNSVVYYFYDPVTAENGSPRQFYNFATGQFITK